MTFSQRRIPCNVRIIQIIAIFCFAELSLVCGQHLTANSPPILYVPERNWRILETEQVGQIITRIRAEDPEHDGLIFGLEPRFLSNKDHNKETKLPFRIDEETGVVYLNESVRGRAGENFFLYVTVSDGDLTAKNEVFVNIIAKGQNSKHSNFRNSPSFTNIVQNISGFFPPFDALPEVKAVRNKYPPNKAQMIPMPPNLDTNNAIFANNHKNAEMSDDVTRLPYIEILNGAVAEQSDENTTTKTNSAQTSQQTGRIRLKPIKTVNKNEVLNGDIIGDAISNGRNISISNAADSKNTKQVLVSDAGKGNTTELKLPPNYSANAVVIPFIVVSCGFIFAVAAFFGFIYRKHFCFVTKKLHKDSGEDIRKKSNQINLTTTSSTDDSRNSVLMQQWSRPSVYSNRYTPWEATSQLNTNDPLNNNEPNLTLSNGVLLNNNVAASNEKCQWEFPRHRLKFFNILGEGAFGQVWRCEATNLDGVEGITTVAVKTLKENATAVEKKDLLSELEVMKSLGPHMNVVQLLGCCTDRDPILVIIEFVNRGKLQTYLRNSRAERLYRNTHGKSNVLTSSDLTSFMYQVAKGMDYLTSRGIIHRDLAARNILITECHTCKIADFGFARDVVTSKIYERKSEGKMPIRWMAIESLYDNIFSTKSDIWSYGILMWEIVTLGSTPYPGISASDVMRKVRDGYRLEKPEHCRRELYNIMYYCWASDPNQRPTFAELVQMFGKLLHTEMDYIQLDRFPDHNYYNIINLSGEKL